MLKTLMRKTWKLEEKNWKLGLHDVLSLVIRQSRLSWMPEMSTILGAWLDELKIWQRQMYKMKSLFKTKAQLFISGMKFDEKNKGRTLLVTVTITKCMMMDAEHFTNNIARGSENIRDWAELTIQAVWPWALAVVAAAAIYTKEPGRQIILILPDSPRF